MVYTCQFCGAWFPKETLVDVIKNNEKIINCPYCNNVNEMESVKTSHVYKGYMYLESGEFYQAQLQFAEALKKNQKSNTAYESAKLDAYLGRALSKQWVQVIYDDDDGIASDTDEPEINCFRHYDTLLSELDDYQMALKIAYSIPFGNSKEAVARVERFAKKIDGIKMAYNKMANKGEEYQLFIAFEDYSKDSEAGMMAANRIRDNLPSSIKNVYIQNPDGMSYEEYEGGLLYAMLHSACMLVVADDDIDFRLMNLYGRYYYSLNDRDDGKGALGFVSIGKDTEITLPDHNVSKNVFDIKDKDGYCRFVCEANMIAYGRSSIFSGLNNITQPKAEREEREERFYSKESKSGAPFFEGQICRFGSYPQRRVMDQKIISVFESEGKPSISSPEDWNVMFKSQTGQPYTWYKDKEIEGKKYRAIYFIKFRDVFTSRSTDIQPSIQRMAKYTPMRIYVFSYDDIDWHILQFSSNSATVISSIGLESREFHNKCDDYIEWSEASLRKWLNEELYNTAFSSEEQKYIYTIDALDDHLSLISDEFLDNSVGSLSKKLNTLNVAGSDYLKCIGGHCDRAVSSFWIKSDLRDCSSAAAVQPHNVGNVVSQHIDTTTVSVLPIIRVKLKD